MYQCSQYIYIYLYSRHNDLISSAVVTPILLIGYPYKDEAQSALFKDSSYRAVNTFHLGYKNNQFML